VNSYSFLPWLRVGVAGTITADPGTAPRASVDVTVRLTGTPLGAGPVTQDVPQPVQLYGPGDVVGVDPRAIVLTEPRHWITDFEPNYLAHIEFYDEDFPWRYSPAPPDGATGRLRPWLALVVLTEKEFTEGGVPDRPLPFVDLADLAVLPPPDQLGAFAHVHVNRSVTPGDKTVSDNLEQSLESLGDVLAENPDLACSRVLCPRRLAPDTVYHAFLVPAFETGRLAGLGYPPEKYPGALQSSWVPYTNRPESTRMCHYHRWQFRTGGSGDFEALVRLLVPRTVGARVGNRDMDVQHPAPNLPGIPGPGQKGVLRLGGALKVPDTAISDPEEQNAVAMYEKWDQPYPHDFQKALATLVNLADDYAGDTASAANQQFLATVPSVGASVNADAGVGPDPVITPPLYGRWHSLTARLLTDRDGNPVVPNDNWVHRLNLDPRFRVAAGLGTRVVQARQEEFMVAAWSQLGQVLEANRRIRAAQLAREVSYVLDTAHLAPLRQTAPDKALAVTALAHSRVIASDLTVSARVAESVVAAAPLSPAMRRATRPGGRLVRGLVPHTVAAVPKSLLERMNDGEVTAAPEKEAPAGVVTEEQLETEMANDVPKLTGIAADDPAADDPVATLPMSENFKISLPDEDFVPLTGGIDDSVEATRFKEALGDEYTELAEAEEAGQVPPRVKLDLAALRTATAEGLDPDHTIPRRVHSGFTLPARFLPGQIGIAADEPPPLAEVMAYPVIDVPMYKPLIDMGSELFLPNLNLIPPNSITLLETNQRFIESYMVGLNHEMARELLWREYPTDQRGTPFRQFWDVSTVLPDPSETPDERRERLRDIPPVHLWTTQDALGEHDHREAGGAPEDELVLVIRGELLKKYPTAVIYAHRAAWRLDDNGDIDPSQERFPMTLTDEEHPPPGEVELPLYEAKADPDIYFFGFDLTEEEARGGTGEPGAQDPGWFFVIKERPGEARFGLDETKSDEIEVWNDLSWADVLTAGAGVQYLQLGPSSPTVVLDTALEADDAEKVKQHEEDVALGWNPTMSASDVAYILFQAPVLMAVHAREMLQP
jgi:hypothetical protein